MHRDVKDSPAPRAASRATAAHDGGAPFTDEELTALALAADPSQPVDRDALPWSPYADQGAYGLPDWYMPRAQSLRRGRMRKVVVLALIAGFLVIDASGLCITSGFLTFA